MCNPVSTDEGLFSFDAQMRGTPRPVAEERRRCRRRRFFAIQRIAPYDGSRLPEEAEFFCAESRDLTSDGVSFLLRIHPGCGSFVVALCEPPVTEYLVAEVVHSTDVRVHPSGLVEPLYRGEGSGDGECTGGEMGEPMVLVGCRFGERLQVVREQGSQSAGCCDADPGR
jgi:hypothetical protein